MEKQKILIVDDSEMNRSLLADILEEQYDVVEAENGVEAITLLSRQRADFSLLLLDIMMPEMDGFEVLAYINKYHWNDTFAVIMISADDSPANIKRAYDLGAFDYISRPFDSTIVKRRISNTMFLYARQQRLEKIIVEQFHEQEKNNKLMISILSHIVEFRNGESGLHMSNHFETVIKLRFGQVSGIVSVVSADNNNKEKLYEELVYRAQVRNFDHLALCSTEGNFQTLYGQSIQPLNPEPFVEALVRGEQRVALGSDPAGNLVQHCLNISD